MKKIIIGLIIGIAIAASVAASLSVEQEPENLPDASQSAEKVQPPVTGRNLSVTLHESLDMRSGP